MNVELQINNSTSARARFVSWVPSPCRIRITNPSGAASTHGMNIKLSSVSAASAGAVVFRKGTTGAFSNTLTVNVPINGTSVSFFVAGRFGRPSSSNGDVKIDAGGVGKLVEMGVKLGRGVKPKLKIGVCGEHGGDPQSIFFFHKVGLDYVSCSPYRVPIARLAAAQAQLESKAHD